MVFSSVIFLSLFLPITIIVFFILPKHFKFWFLVVISLIFYAWGELGGLWVMMTSTILDYACGLGIRISRERNSKNLPRFFLYFSITINLLLLLYFKYSNFFAENLIDLGVNGTNLKFFQNVALPLGISFYTFQSMSYTIDVYWGNIKATKDFAKFAGYVTLFPQLVAGPIVRYRDIEDQLDFKYLRKDEIYRGLIRFVLGLSKKVLIANTLGNVADKIFALNPGELNTPLAWLGIISYSFQIYFDFSGYSDMAIGLGSVFGFKFPENFNYPYISQSVTEFWQRWHISLSTWWRDYVYIPLGGNRDGKFKTYRNLTLVFFLCGLWHGASWTFVFWGMLHGLFLILEKSFIGKGIHKMPRLLRHIYTLTIIMIGWVYFRADDFSYANNFISVMFFQGETSFSHNLSSLSFSLKSEELLALFLAFLFSTPIYTLIKNAEKAWPDLFKFSEPIQSLVLLVINMSYLAGSTYNPFIYFRF